MHSNFVKKI